MTKHKEIDDGEGPKEILPMSRWVALLLLGAASATLVAASWNYLFSAGAPYGDDNSSHIALMLQMAHLMRGGHTDLFFNQVNLGVPLFLSYQPLPGMLTGVFASLALCCQSPIWVYKLFVVLLWALMPWSWYCGGRWLGLHRAAAVALGLLVLGVRAHVDVGLTFQSIAYKGLFTQSFGILVLPLALGSWYRYLHLEKGHWRTPLFWLAMAFLCHGFFGMYAAIGTACMIIAGKRKLHRFFRALPLYTGVVLLISWWLVPLLQHKGLIGGLPWRTAAQNGWEWKELGHLIIERKLFDHERIPWMTSLMLFGMWGLWRRRNEFIFAQWWVYFAFVTGLLFLGRTNFGTYYQWLPLHGELNVMRYLNGVHALGLLLAAIGVYHLLMLLYAALYNEWGESTGMVGMGLAIAFASGAFLQHTYEHVSDRLRTFDHHAPSYRRVLKRLTHDRRSSRFVVGKRLGTSSHFHRDLLPALSRRPQLQSYGMSFHATHSTYFIEYFDYTPLSYSLYNVGHVVSKLETPPIPKHGLTKILSAPPYHVFATGAAKGYFSFIRVPATIYGPFKQIRGRLKSMLPTWYQRDALPAIVDASKAPDDTKNAMVFTSLGAFSQRLNGKSVSMGTSRFIAQAVASQRPPHASVLRQRHDMTTYTAHVEVKDAKAWLLLRVNYFPYWQATVDGESANVTRVAPNFMAIQVPKGRHKVHFAYRNPTWQKWGFLFGMLALMAIGGWVVWPTVRRGWEAIKDWQQARRDPSVPPSVK